VLRRLLPELAISDRYSFPQLDSGELADLAGQDQLELVIRPARARVRTHSLVGVGAGNFVQGGDTGGVLVELSVELGSGLRAPVSDLAPRRDKPSSALTALITLVSGFMVASSNCWRVWR
jgi:hypothetical protein